MQADIRISGSGDDLDVVPSVITPVIQSPEQAPSEHKNPECAKRDVPKEKRKLSVYLKCTGCQDRGHKTKPHLYVVPESPKHTVGYAIRLRRISEKTGDDSCALVCGENRLAFACICMARSFDGLEPSQEPSGKSFYRHSMNEPPAVERQMSHRQMMASRATVLRFPINRSSA